jgi:hypothetical protein
MDNSRILCSRELIAGFQCRFHIFAELYSGGEEEDLMGHNTKMSFDNHLANSDTSLHSDQSNEGISFTVKDHTRIHFNIPAN